MQAENLHGCMRMLLALTQASSMHIGQRFWGASNGEEELTFGETILYVCIVTGLVLIAGIASGLTLGLLGLEVGHLQVGDPSLCRFVACSYGRWHGPSRLQPCAVGA